MASYTELHQIIGLETDGALDLYNKVAIAGLISADTISSGNDDGAPFGQEAGDHDQRVKWAELAYSGSDAVKDQLFRAVIAANDDATQSAILTASDATIQTAVDAVIDTLAANL